jgi:hypothetical protein
MYVIYILLLSLLSVTRTVYMADLLAVKGMIVMFEVIIKRVISDVCYHVVILLHRYKYC